MGWEASRGASVKVHHGVTMPPFAVGPCILCETLCVFASAVFALTLMKGFFSCVTMEESANISCKRKYILAKKDTIKQSTVPQSKTVTVHSLDLYSIYVI